MKNTKKKGLIFTVIGVVLVIALLGGVIFGVVKAISNVSDDLENALNGESDTNEYDGFVSEDDPSSEDDPPTGEDAESDVDTNQTVFVYGVDDNISVAGKLNNDKGIFSVGVVCNNLKPNTEYRMYWQIDTSYEDYGFSISTDTVDGEVVYEALVFLSPSGGSAKSVTSTERSYLLNNTEGITISTDDNAMFLVCPFLCDQSLINTYGNTEFWNTVKSLIRSFRIEEVT